MHVKNERGFSLVNVLIAIGLTGVLSVILMKISEQQAQIQKKAVTDNEVNEVVNLFRGMISKKDSCNATLQGLKLGNTFEEFRFDYNRNSAPFAEVTSEEDSSKATRFSNTKIIVREMKLLNKSEVEALGDNSIKYSSKVAVLKLTLEKSGSTLGGKHTIKYFQIPANIGHGEIIWDQSPQLVIQECEKREGQISDFESGEVASDKESAILSTSSNFVGYCAISNVNDDIILGCI